jgi:hypothetical protein
MLKPCQRITTPRFHVYGTCTTFVVVQTPGMTAGRNPPQAPAGVFFDSQNPSPFSSIPMLMM